MFAYIFKIYF
jgi:hypothetical protein